MGSRRWRLASRESRRMNATAIAVLTLWGAACTRQREPADMVLVGGLVWARAGTPLSAPNAPTAVAIRGGRIVAVGSDAEVETLAGPATERIALDGRRVVPGFIDNHVHFFLGGPGLAQVQLRDARTPAEFVRRIAEFAVAHPGRWMTWGAWDHENWGAELPRRDWIDSVTRETPVFVRRLDGHMGLANSRALALANVTAATPEPSGGTIVRYPDGRPTGVLKDAAMQLVARVIPPATATEWDEALAAAMTHAVERGVTMWTDLDNGSFTSLETYRRARGQGRLPIRVYAVLPLAAWDRLAELIAEEGRGDDRLFWGGVKGFVDGSIGSTTAWFYEPYTDAPHTRGILISDTSVLRRQIISADSAGLQVLIHGIGDRANDWLLGVYQQVRERNGPRDRRLRIEHAQHPRPAAITRYGTDSVIASVQPYHAIDDGRWAEKRIGAERIKTTYPFRSFLDAGARLTFGSDWPVAPLDPLLGIYAAVTRRTIDGANPNGWVPAQRISVEEAVTAYTASNAFASHRERALGTLEPGKYADLVVLSADIFSIPPERIEGVKADLTMVEGKVVYRRTPATP